MPGTPPDARALAARVRPRSASTVRAAVARVRPTIPGPADAVQDQIALSARMRYRTGRRLR